MTECDYCGESFDSEDAYLNHLQAEHRDELGRIDQKRVEQHRQTRSVSAASLQTTLKRRSVMATMLIGSVALISYFVWGQRTDETKEDSTETDEATKALLGQ